VEDRAGIRRLHRAEGVSISEVGIDPVDRVVYQPGEVTQFDLWFPEISVPVAAGQARVLPALVMSGAVDRPDMGGEDGREGGPGSIGREWQRLRPEDCT